MFGSLLLSLAITASSTHEPITIVESAPTVVIRLARYDLANSRDVDNLRHRIVSSAKMICEDGYRGLQHQAAIACAKTAIADANAQLNRVLAQNASSAGLGAAIAITVSKQ